MAPRKPIAASPQKLAEARSWGGTPYSELIGLGLGFMMLGVWWSSLGPSWLDSYRAGLDYVLRPTENPSIDTGASLFAGTLAEGASGWLTLLLCGTLLAILLHGGPRGSGSAYGGYRGRPAGHSEPVQGPTLWSAPLLGLWMLGLGVAALPAALAWIYGSTEEFGELVTNQAMPLSLLVGGGVLVLGGLDLIAQRVRWKRGLRMTHREARERRRREQGDPRWRRVRRNVQRSLVRQEFDAMVRKALLVVTGDADGVFLIQGGAPPSLIAAERGFRGVEILRAAERHAVVTVRDPSLSRVLAGVRVGQVVPQSAYGALAYGYASSSGTKGS